MSRRLPTKPNDNQKIIIVAVKDYYGEGATPTERREQKQIALWLMNRRKGVHLTEDQKEDLEHIRVNLKDKLYIAELCDTPTLGASNFILRPRFTAITAGQRPKGDPNYL